jgi:hypothetical protein
VPASSSHLIDGLQVDGLEVTPSDNLSSRDLENVNQHDGKKSFSSIRGDIRRLDMVKDAVKETDALARAIGIRHSYADINRVKKVFAYDPKVSLRSRLCELAKNFRG